MTSLLVRDHVDHSILDSFMKIYTDFPWPRGGYFNQDPSNVYYVAEGDGKIYTKDGVVGNDRDLLLSQAEYLSMKGLNVSYDFTPWSDAAILGYIISTLTTWKIKESA